jgi:nicotine blue oxidoreductase
VVSGAAPISVAQAAVVHNPHWAGGMSSSLRVGLGAMPDDATAVVVTLVDTPWIGPEAVTRLITARQDGAELAVATYDGVRGHPVLLGREHWQGVIDLSHDDVGARAYLAQYPDGVAEIDCTSTGDPSDVDTPDDL